MTSPGVGVGGISHRHSWSPCFWAFAEYTVTMHDHRTPALRWNTTYRRYSAPPMDSLPGKCECCLSLAPTFEQVLRLREPLPSLTTF